MNRPGVLGISCAALFALASSASAGPMSMAPSDVIAPPQPKVEMAAYRHYYHRHYAHRHYYYRHGRYYAVNPVLECDTGVQAGHLEILVLRRWLLILSKAR